MSDTGTDSGVESRLSSLSIETEWIDVDDPGLQATANDLYERIVGTVTSIDQEEGVSTYSFRGVIRYAIDPDMRGFEIVEYSGDGVLLEGVDRGAIHYCSRGGWRGAADESRRFEVSGVIDWSDDFNSERPLDVKFRGVLLDGNQIGYLTTAISGLAVLGQTTPARLLMDVPALL
jgi:hypothetical protein